MGDALEVTPRLGTGTGERLSARVRTLPLAVDLVVVSVAALVLGLIRLGAPSLWVDESFTVAEGDTTDGTIP